jgi:translation initiation factor 1
MYARVRVTNNKRESGFGSLEKLRDQLPVGTASPKPEPAVAKGPARAVVRLERKQRRGKEVTVIEKLGLRSAELDTWCGKLKQALGCGGTVEDDAIVLQGDFRKRVPELLAAMGVGRVTVAG